MGMSVKEQCIPHIEKTGGSRVRPKTKVSCCVAIAASGLICTINGIGL